MVYQEDVTKVAMALADFSLEDADQLRKVISKKHKSRQLRDYYHQFCRGAAKNPIRGVASTPSKDLDDDHELRRLQFLQTPFGQLCPGLLQIRLSAGPLSGGIYRIRHQQPGADFIRPSPMSPKRAAWDSAILPPDVNASDWAIAAKAIVCGSA